MGRAYLDDLTDSFRVWDGHRARAGRGGEISETGELGYAFIDIARRGGGT